MHLRYLRAGLVGMILQCGVVLSVSAGPPQGFYVGASAGYASVGDATYDLLGAAVVPHPAEFDRDFAFAIFGGYDLEKARVELELARRENDVDSFGRLGGVGPGKGDITADTLMLNVFYDFDRNPQIVPYVGAGLGFANVDANQIRRDVTAPSRTGIVYGDDTVFGFQLIAGVMYQFTDRLGVTLDYTYLQTNDPELNYSTGCLPDGTDCGFTGQLEEDYDAHRVSVGLRWAF